MDEYSLEWMEALVKVSGDVVREGLVRGDLLKRSEKIHEMAVALLAEMRSYEVARDGRMQ